MFKYLKSVNDACNFLKMLLEDTAKNAYPHFFSYCKQSSGKVTITSALTVPTVFTVFTFLLYCVWRGPSHSETVDTETDGQTVPGSAHSLRSRGNNSRLSMGLWQERSRLRAFIPETFPLFPPSFLQILHPLPHPPPLRLPCSSLPFNITSSLCLVGRRSKSQGFSSREEGCYGAWFLEEKKMVDCSGRVWTRAPLCCSSEQQGEGTGGWSVGGEEQCRMSLTIGQQLAIVSRFIFHWCVIRGGRNNPQELHFRSQGSKINNFTGCYF